MSGQLRREFMDRALSTILAKPDHRLSFLVDRSKGTWLGRSHLDYDSPSVQAGHVTSRHSGAQERLALEDAFKNQRASWRGESRGVIEQREAIEIDGVPLEKMTARMYERQAAEGFPGLAPGTVDAAPAHTGWADGEPLSQVPATNLRVPDPDPAPPQRFHTEDPSDRDALAEQEALAEQQRAARDAAARGQSVAARVGEAVRSAGEAIGSAAEAIGPVGIGFIATAGGIGGLAALAGGAIAAGADRALSPDVPAERARPAPESPAAPAADPAAPPADPAPKPAPPPQASPPTGDTPQPTRDHGPESLSPHPAPAAGVTPPSPPPPTPEAPDRPDTTATSDAVALPAASMAALATSTVAGAAPLAAAAIGDLVDAAYADPAQSTIIAAPADDRSSGANWFQAPPAGGNDAADDAGHAFDPGRSGDDADGGAGDDSKPGATWYQAPAADGNAQGNDRKDSDPGTGSSGQDGDADGSTAGAGWFQSH